MKIQIEEPPKPTPIPLVNFDARRWYYSKQINSYFYSPDGKVIIQFNQDVLRIMNRDEVSPVFMVVAVDAPNITIS